MEIAEYSSDKDEYGFLSQIESCDWDAAKFLASIIKSRRFEPTLGGWAKLFVLSDGGRLVSFITLSCQDCVADRTMFPWMGFLFTFPEYRGNRYGKKVIDYACSVARNMGYNAVYLATEHVGLYEKYGFAYSETREDVYGEESRIYSIAL